MQGLATAALGWLAFHGAIVTADAVHKHLIWDASLAGAVTLAFLVTVWRIYRSAFPPET